MDAICGRGKSRKMDCHLTTVPFIMKMSDTKYSREKIYLYLIRNMTKIWLDHIQWSISLIITNMNNDNYIEEKLKEHTVQITV